MKIAHIKIHNFRSIKDGEFDLENYNLLIGENNSGKSTVINALRTFYENDGLKFSASRDFPKFETEDKESWIEIEFSLTEDENENLRDEYKLPDNRLKVRKYFQSENKELVSSQNSNIFAYEHGELSKNNFYGAKNISQTKLGRVIFIPEISKTSDTLKLSGPSPLRDITNFVFSRIVKTSPSYSALNSAFDSFNKEFDEESKKEDFSFNNLKKDINSDLESWDIAFGLRVNPIKPTDIVKNLLGHYIIDKNLGEKEVSIESLGQGVQRHLIYTLIKLSSKYTEIKEPKKKEFSPDLTLLLFEEPEAFLHPTQQENLNLSLKKLSESTQIILTTHSPVFVSRNTKDLSSLIKLNKLKSISTLHFLSDEKIDELFNNNIGLLKFLEGEDIDESAKIYEESFKYFLWLDSERSASFFSKHVIICEGATEKAFLDLMINTKWIDLKEKQLYFLDCLGKFNIHRFMNIFGELGIKHSILFDGDNNKGKHEKINDFINSNKNDLTHKIAMFEDDLEAFLGVEKAERPDLKPLNLLLKYESGKIEEKRIDELKTIIEGLV
jgi:putative ATP-dependent endonuclease of the OLD family